MKVETVIVYLNSYDREYANKLSGDVFTSIEDLKCQLANDGINLIGTQTLYEFQNEWNNTDDDVIGLKKVLTTSMITYTYIVRQ